MFLDHLMTTFIIKAEGAWIPRCDGKVTGQSVRDPCFSPRSLRDQFVSAEGPLLPEGEVKGGVVVVEECCPT